MDINEPLHGQIHLWMIIVVIILGYLAVAGNIYWAKRHVRDQRGTRIVFGFILFCYAVVYAYLTFFYRTPMKENHVKLEPFWSYKEAFEGLSISRLGVVRSIVLNIAITIPLGYLLPSAYRSTHHRYLHTMLTVLFLSLVTEILQLITRTGLCETDDVINNMFGAAIGMVMYRVAEKGLNR